MRRPRVVLPALLVVIVLVVAGACGSAARSGAGPGSTTGSDLRASLEGRTFDSTSVTAAGVDRPLVLGRPVTMTFEAETLRANAGCNGMGGHYSLDGDHLTVGDLSSTAMACAEPGLMEQDAWFGSLLTAGATLALDGDRLTMTSGDTVIVFVDHATVDPDRPLVGTTWTLESIIDGETASSVPVGVTATFTIADDHTASWGACNRSGGQVSSIGATSLTISDVRSTEIGCPPPADGVDRAMNAVLHDTVTYEVDGAVLHVHQGAKGLDLRAP